MILSTVLENIDFDLIAGSTDIKVTSLDENSRNITNGSVFVAVKGNTNDAHKYIPDAISKGASAIVVDRNRSMYEDSELKAMAETSGVTIVAIDDTRRNLGLLIGAFLEHPERKLDMIGLTGTKGKTTTTFMLHEIMSFAKLKSGLIGTVYSIVDGKKNPVNHTTPVTIDLYNLLGQMADCNTDNCIMEVSSLGVKLHRVGGIDFKVGCFTNFFEDHISPEEHPDMEDYLLSKLQMFDHVENAVVNKDSRESDRVIDYVSSKCKKTIAYCVDGDADVVATNISKCIKNDKIGTSFDLKSPWYNGEVFVALPGLFSVYNALCSICVASVLGIDFDAILKGLEMIKVPGRVEAVENKLGVTVLVDYAHTGDSLESVLKALRDYTDGKIISVFGCGGGRSPVRRIGMGEASGKYADYSVITTDNPRDEEPMAIIEHILDGIKPTGGEYTIVVDRKEGIEAGIKMAKPGDLVLIAGKGHEDYQIVKGVKSHFDDREVAASILRKLEE